MTNTSIKKIRVAELFAGVGGFRLGLDGKNKKFYETVWSNQWEPSTKKQHASEVYKERFKTGIHSNENISDVPAYEIPDHDLLVGGFPCQDYSVARNLGASQGLSGKKGVLWWDIHRILKEKGKKAPKYLMLENVDRLLKSPASQRGRDFAIMLASLNDLGYAVEWRVINAAEYGMPQRRRRIFILGYKSDSSIFKELEKTLPSQWILDKGIISSAFKVDTAYESFRSFEINGELDEISDSFNVIGGKSISPFENSGVSINRKVMTIKTLPKFNGKKIKLGDILVEEASVPEDFFISDEDLERWEYLKGSKNESRTTSSGHEFIYSEGAMVFPDRLDRPSRTIITGEGGSSPSRFKHVIKTKSGRLRRLTPIELERLNMFPDNHTAGQTDTKRAFFMGNALVIGVIDKLGKSLARRINT